MQTILFPSQKNETANDTAIFTDAYLRDIVYTRYPKHPFENITGTKEDLRFLLTEYCAMSTAFPYLQAAACGPVVLDSIKNNTPIKHAF